MRKKLIITMGDASGIGPEITVKALGDPKIYEKTIPVVYGDYAAMEDAIAMCHSSLRLERISRSDTPKGIWGTIEIVDFGFLPPDGWSYKQNQAITGNAAFHYITAAIEDTMAGKYDAIVTGPISKEALHMAGHQYSGHTEILAAYTGTRDYAMLLSSEQLKVIHVTTHVSMEEACRRITPERVFRVIQLAQLGLEQFGIKKPRIAVAGFNAHCSENGLFGSQEAEAIIPAVEKTRSLGMDVTGPIPPDTVFCKAVAGAFDVVVAMYHDQGHIPIKLLGFRMDPVTGVYGSMSGINCTIGLPIIRTSVDHGTAFGKAGEGRANAQSMTEAIAAAALMAENFHRAP